MGLLRRLHEPAEEHRRLPRSPTGRAVARQCSPVCSSSGWSEPTRFDRQCRSGRRSRRRPGARRRPRRPKAESPPYKSFLEEHRPALRFHFRAVEHLLQQILVQEAYWDCFFEHTQIKPILVLYENFAGDYTTSTTRLLERLGLPAGDLAPIDPPLKRQSDAVNDDWVRRFSDLKLGAEFDLVPAVGSKV